MIRLIGIICVGGGFAWFALRAICRMKEHIRDLSQVINGLETMVRELDYSLGTLPELLRQAAEVSQGPVKDFFLQCAKGAELLAGRTFQHVWEEALRDTQMLVDPEDALILEQLGSVLGRYDRDGLRTALLSAAAQLEEHRKTSAEQFGHKSKVYGALGFTAGGFLIILLL